MSRDIIFLIIFLIDDPKSYFTASLLSKEWYRASKIQRNKKMIQFSKRCFIKKYEHYYCISSEHYVLPNGEMHGPRIMYNLTHLYISCNYNNGLLSGEHKEYYGFGGGIYKAGKYKIFIEKGEKVSRKHGIWKKYSTIGEVICETMFEKGLPISKKRLYQPL